MDLPPYKPSNGRGRPPGQIHRVGERSIDERGWQRGRQMLEGLAWRKQVAVDLLSYKREGDGKRGWSRRTYREYVRKGR